MIKLIASDIDGTLVKDGTLMLNPEYYDVILKLKEKGITFVACSGRQFISEKKLFSPVKNDILYVTDGGTVIRTPSEILKVYPLETHLWKGMYESVKNMPACDCFICLPDFSLAEDAHSSMFCWLRDSYGYDIREVENLSKIQSEEGIKFTVYHKNACEEMCKPEFIPAWQDKAKVACAGKEWVDCIANGASKGTAIRWLQQYLNVTPEETCVFGDNLNDMEMLQAAKYSYAVENARDEVKKAANYIAASYKEDGVLKVLKEILEKA